MFVVKLNEAKYEYDIHSLVKAFYPEEEVKVLTPDTDEKKARELEFDIKMEVTFRKEDIHILLPGGSPFCFMPQEMDGDRSAKDQFKRFLYTTLSTYTGTVLPWGNLTGIRPTKIALGLLEEGRSEEQIKYFMQEEHFVSEEKASLSVEIAGREKELLSGLHFENGYSLYIGIPFCPTTCLYCSFTSNPICKFQNRVEEYIDCLIEEMKYVSKAFSDKILDSVYIGGGTPTTLEASSLDRLLTALQENFDFSTVIEFTVEAGRADSITKDKLEVLKKHNVGRISINPQTMNGDTLKVIGRQATPLQVKEAFRLARETADFNINMDIILGLPGEGEQDVTETMKEIIEMKPDSLTVHSLAIKRASKLSQWIKEYGLTTIHNTDTTMEIASKGAKVMKMHPYYLYRQKNMSGNFENVGYATEGNYGIYNILIMEEKQTIMALGAGSITKVVFPDGRIERTDNVKDVSLYIEKIDEMIARKQSMLEMMRKSV